MVVNGPPNDEREQTFDDDKHGGGNPNAIRHEKRLEDPIDDDEIDHRPEYAADDHAPVWQGREFVAQPADLRLIDIQQGAETGQSLARNRIQMGHDGEGKPEPDRKDKQDWIQRESGQPAVEPGKDMGEAGLQEYEQ